MYLLKFEVFVGWPECFPLNQLPFKPIAVAVVVVKAAGTFRLAVGPKTIPAGFIKNRLDCPPLTWIKPWMLEGLPPETRARIYFRAREKFGNFCWSQSKLLKTMKQICPISGKLTTLDVKLVTLGRNDRPCTICSRANWLRQQRLSPYPKERERHTKTINRMELHGSLDLQK